MPREFKKRLMRKVRALFSCHSKTPLKTLPCHNSTSVNEPPKIVMERRSSGSPSNQPVKQKPRGIRMSRRAVQRSKYLREKFGVRKTVMGFSPREGSISEEDENDMTLWRLAENAEDVIIDGLAWLKNDDGNDDGDEDDNYVDDDDDEEKILQRWIESNSFDSLNNYDDNYRDDDDVSLLSDDDDIHDDDDDVNHYGRNNHNKDCNHDEDYNDDDDNKSDADDNDDNNGENNGDNNSDNNGDNNSDNNGDNNDDDYNDDSDVDDDYVFISNDDLKSNPNSKAISDEKNESIDDDDDDDDKNESFDDGDYDDDDDDKNESIDDDDYDDDDKNDQLVQEPKAENHYRNASHKSYLSNHMKDSQNIDTVYSSTINECVDINPNNCLQQSDYPDRSVSKGRVDKDMNKNFSLNGIKMSKMSPKDASKSSTKIEEKISWKNSSDASVDKHMLAVSANCKVNQRPLNLDAENDDDTVNNNNSGLKGDVSHISQSDVINTTRHGNPLPNDVISQTAKTLESHSGIAALVENANSKKSVTEKANVSKRESDASSGSSETLEIEEKEKRVSEESEEFGVGNESDQNGFENVFDSMKKDMEAVWCRMENIENDFILARTTLNEMRTDKKN